MLSPLIEIVYNFLDRFHAKRIRHYFSDQRIGFVIDVGAHKGEFIRLVVDQAVPVFVFEPQTSVHTILERAIAHHNVLHLHKSAVSDVVGEVDLYVNFLSSTTSILLPEEKSAWMRFKKTILGGKLVKAVEKVPVTALDATVLPKLENLSDGFLKIDVEGNEGRVLAGAEGLLASGRVKFVQIERSRYQIYKGDLPDPVEILRRCGFKKQKSFLFPLLNFSDVVFRRMNG